MSGFSDLKPSILYENKDSQLESSETSSFRTILENRSNSSSQVGKEHNGKRKEDYLASSSGVGSHFGSPGFTLDSIVMAQGSNFSLGKLCMISRRLALLK
jgi:hypothetical protein